MQKAYSRIIWENEPSEATPLNERNLNKMDYALDIIDNRVIDYSQYKEDAAESAAEALASQQAAAQSELNAAKSELAASVSEVNAAQSEQNAAQSEYNTAQSEQNAAQSEINAAQSESKAKQSETFADNWRLLSESHNHGNTGVRTGEDTDNSEYWSKQSRIYSDNSANSATDSATSASASETSRNEAQLILDQIKSYAKIIVPNFWLDVDTGILYISEDVQGIDFQLDDDTGILYYSFTY